MCVSTHVRFVLKGHVETSLLESALAQNKSKPDQENTALKSEGAKSEQPAPNPSKAVKSEQSAPNPLVRSEAVKYEQTAPNPVVKTEAFGVKLEARPVESPCVTSKAGVAKRH